MDNALEEPVISPGEVDAAASPRRHLEVWLPVTIVTVDQATKAMVKSSLALHESVTIIPGFIDFTHVLNSGAAFGILNGVEFPFKTVLIAVIAMAALVGVALYAASISHHQLIARVGLALIIGGAAGNLIDRATEGAVIDWIDPVAWPAFNIADVAITFGVLSLVYGLEGKREGP